jgi:hypothetical protein
VKGYLDRVHVDLVSPMPVKSVGGWEYKYVAVDDYSCVVYARPMCLKSEAADVFKMFRAVAENASGRKMRKVMTDNMRELAMGEIREV